MAMTLALSIAQRALLAHQRALAVVANNIANASTRGYTRQVPVLAADPTRLVGDIPLGGGVGVRLLLALDPILDRRLLAAETERREASLRHQQLAALAGALGDLEAPSLASALDGFFAAADALARSPQGLPERQTVLARAGALSAEIVRRHGAVAGQQRDADAQVVAAAGRADAALERIAELNRRIVAAEAGGEAAGELRDERQRALAAVAGVLPVSVVEDAQGAVTVSGANGIVLVTGSDVVHRLALRAGAAGLDGRPLHEVGVAGPGGFVAVPELAARGELGALIAARDGSLVAAAAALDTFARALRDGVNGVQTDPAAVDLDGNGTATAPVFAGSGAADLAVALADPRRLAAALSTEPGDNQNALRLAGLRTTALASLGGVTLVAHLAAEQTRLGEAAARAADAAVAAERFAQQLEGQRASLSGVNLNEELAHLAELQRAFEAATRVVTVADAMLGDLLEAIGR